MIIREGNMNDLYSIYQLGQNTWSKFEKDWSDENWKKMSAIISDKNLYQSLLQNSKNLLCENDNGEIIGMSFWVASGNLTEIYNETMLNSVCNRFRKIKRKKLGQKLTEKCIELTKNNGKTKIVLHTSEFMDKARHFYEKLGFRIIKEIEPKYGKKHWLYEMNL